VIDPAVMADREKDDDEPPIVAAEPVKDTQKSREPIGLGQAGEVWPVPVGTSAHAAPPFGRRGAVGGVLVAWCAA
jgi:hypothetical protein